MSEESVRAAAKRCGHLHCAVSRGSVVANGGGAHLECPSAARLPAKLGLFAARCSQRETATKSVVAVGCGPGFGFGRIGALTQRARGTDFSNGGRGSGEVVTNFSIGRRTGGLHRRRRYRRARSRGRYTWLGWRSARCERLDCGGNDGARDRRAQAFDDEGVTGQNSVFGPDDAVSRDEPNNILYIPAMIRRARSRPCRGTAPVGIDKAWRAQIGRGQLTGRDGRAPSQFEQSPGIA